jgi:hypothetical protein
MDGFENGSDEADLPESDFNLASAASSNSSASEKEFFARVELWREGALRHPDDQQACIGALTAGIARILHAQQMAIERSIESCKTTLLEEPAVQIGITAQAGLLRQFHSMLGFEVRLEKIRRDAKNKEVQHPLDTPPRKTH